MEDLWNLSNVVPPVVCNVKTRINVEKITEVKNIVSDGILTLQKCEDLNLEAATLSRFLYKQKRPLRHDKGTKALSKIMKCLRQYKYLNLEEILSNYKECFPSKVERGHMTVYLPTRQMLKYVLIRLQTFSKLFQRIVNTCEEACIHILLKMKLGWSGRSMILALSVTSRIWIISKYLLLKSVEWYKQLYTSLNCFKETIDYFVEYKLPPDLKTWLGVDLDINVVKKVTTDTIFEMIDLVEEDVSDDDDDDGVKKTKMAAFLSDIVDLSDEDTSDSIEMLVEKQLSMIRKSSEHSAGSSSKIGFVKRDQKKSKRNLEDSEDDIMVIHSVPEDIGEPVSRKKLKSKSKR